MEAIWIIFFLVVGACVGSFLNVVIYRVPRGESIVFPGSHCPSCGSAIRWYDNIPVLSFLLLKARCRTCKTAISPRYILIEAATGGLVAGLWVCYYVLDIRHGIGSFSQTWTMFAAHAALLCGLLACSVVDIDNWIVPLEVCWFVSLLGLACSAASPRLSLVPAVSPATGAASLAAAVGIAVSLVLMKYGLIRQSFIDAQDKPVTASGLDKTGKKVGSEKIVSAAITKKHGVNPRREILHELIFLSPAAVLGVGAYLLVARFPAVAQAWGDIASPASGGPYAPHVSGLLGALFGYLVGGLWIWGARILGTLAFGKEAMGLGDAHLLAAVGAVTGWIVPSVVFFVAPFFALSWALYLFVTRKQRELPYGPWLAAGTLVVMLFHDGIGEYLNWYFGKVTTLVQ